MNRQELFVRALDELNKKRRQQPGFLQLWQALISQLEYLVAHETFDKKDAITLKTICVGHMAMKNVEDWDADLAELLLSVQSQVDALYKELAE